jgi:hypothetical protein
MNLGLMRFHALRFLSFCFFDAEKSSEAWTSFAKPCYGRIKLLALLNFSSDCKLTSQMDARMSAKLRMIVRQPEIEVGYLYSTAPYIVFVQGLVIKARDGSSADMDQYAREIYAHL